MTVEWKVGDKACINGSETIGVIQEIQNEIAKILTTSSRVIHVCLPDLVLSPDEDLERLLDEEELIEAFGNYEALEKILVKRSRKLEQKAMEHKNAKQLAKLAESEWKKAGRDFAAVIEQIGRV